MSVLLPSAYEEAGAKSERPDAAAAFGMVLITVVMPATATPSIIHGINTCLSVLGEDVLGESLLRYTWVVTSGPPAAKVEFTENASNRAKNTTASFSAPGRYTFACTLSNGLFATVSSVEVNVEEIAMQFAA